MLAEIVVGSMVVGDEHDLRNQIVIDNATQRADIATVVKVTGGLVLENTVGSAIEIGEFVESLRVRGRGGQHVALAVEQIDLHSGQHDVVRPNEAIAFGISVNITADAIGNVLAEIVIDAVRTGANDNLRDKVVVDHAPQRTNIAAIVEISWRLMFVNAVGAGRQIDEFVIALIVRRGRVDDMSLGVEQIDLHPRQHDVVGADNAISLRIGMHAAANAAGQLLAKIVVDAVDI